MGLWVQTQSLKLKEQIGIQKNLNAVSVLDAGRLNDDTKFLGKFVTYFVCSKEYAENFTNKEINNVLLNLSFELKKSLLEIN